MAQQGLAKGQAMTFAFQTGRFDTRLAETKEDIAACQALRHQCFHGGDGLDVDAFDAVCQHVMVTDGTGLVATCRILSMTSGQEINRSYAAQRYDLKSFFDFERPVIEIGRFCSRADVQDMDVIRLVWCVIARVVDDLGAGLLFGCASFQGIKPQGHAAAFGLLKRRFQGPQARKIGIRSSEVIVLEDTPAQHSLAMAQMPPLLRSYLTMGGWVSDHAVIDREMGTMHVFCGVEVDRIPPARAKALRALAS